MIHHDFDSVTVNLLGGLGNQLFQLAAAFGIACESDLPLRTTAAERYLNVLPLLGSSFADLCPTTSRKGVLTESTFHRVPWAPKKDLRGVPRNVLSRLAGMRRIAPRAFEGPDEISGQNRGSVLLDGYFQHPGWYEPGINAIIERIRTSHKYGIDDLEEGAVGVFVRRGDYPMSWRLEDMYYSRAAEHALAAGAIKFNVISEDANAAADFLKLIQTLGSDARVNWEPRGVVEDLLFGASHKSLILANSTFAWWSAKLGEVVGNVRPNCVYGPLPWMRNEDTELIRPPWKGVDLAFGTSKS